jgi:small nuclear ribonucleoprotein (snRNP)-like protein
VLGTGQTVTLVTTNNETIAGTLTVIPCATGASVSFSSNTTGTSVSINLNGGTEEVGPIPLVANIGSGRVGTCP